MVKLQPHPRFNRRFKQIADKRGRERRPPTSRSPKRRRTSSKETDRRSQKRRAVIGKVIGKNPERNVGAHNNKIRESPPERRRWRVKRCSSEDQRPLTRALRARHRNARETRRSRTRDSKAIGKRYRSTSVERRSRTFAAAKAMPKAAAKTSQAKTVGGGHPRSPKGARSETEKYIPKNPKKLAAWPKPFTKHDLDARSIVVSCGINNCVDSNYSNKSCREFSNWQRQTYRNVVKADHLSDNPGARERFLRSFRKNFPSLCEGRNIQVVDCTAFRNPGDDETGRRHTGAHPDIMHNVYTHKLFRQVHSDLRSMTPTGKNLVIIVCRSGRHRSVASAIACSDVIRERMYNGEQGTVRVVHLQQDTHWNGLCHQACSACDLKNIRREKMMRLARNILNDIVPTNLPLGASPNRAAISPIPAAESKFGGPKADKIDDHHADPSKGRWRDDKKNRYPEQPQSSRDEQKRRPYEKDAESTNKKKKWQGDNDKQQQHSQLEPLLGKTSQSKSLYGCWEPHTCSFPSDPIPPLPLLRNFRQVLIGLKVHHIFDIATALAAISFIPACSPEDYCIDEVANAANDSSKRQRS